MPLIRRIGRLVCCIRASRPRVASRLDSANRDSSTMKIVKDFIRLRIVLFKPVWPVRRFGAGHSQIAVRAEIPHG